MCNEYLFGLLDSVEAVSWEISEGFVAYVTKTSRLNYLHIHPYLFLSIVFFSVTYVMKKKKNPLLDIGRAVFDSLHGAFSVAGVVTYVTNSQTCNVCSEADLHRGVFRGVRPWWVFGIKRGISLHCEASGGVLR